MLMGSSQVVLNSDYLLVSVIFFFQAEDGIRDSSVTGVQTCALPISRIETWGVRYFGWMAATRRKNSPSRAMANGTRAPERIEPFSAARIEIMTVMVATRAPQSPSPMRIIPPAPFPSFPTPEAGGIWE